MRLPEDQIEELRVVAAIHDVGKLSVPGEILSKPARLSPLEFELAQTHVQAGYDILKNVDLPWNLAEIVLQHHEKYDGTGYPHGLSGQQIHLSARILCVADSMEAMLSHRPYRPALTVEDALAEIELLAGKWYDPDVVNACLHVFRVNGFALEEL
jgi:HD-GYP domain-containing protein (c-di-GMP phosphodiesterase class II)